MIRITLYENCILNETYKNVFSLEIQTGQTKNVLEKYLDTLNKMTFDGDYIYYENAGELVIDYKLGQKNIYDYNYMKVEEFNDEDDSKILERYCFIQDIALKNDCAYITYEEDIWSSYANKIKGLTKSYLERSRLLSIDIGNAIDTPNMHTINLHKLPVDYNGINNLKFNSIFVSDYYFVMFKLQYWERVNDENVIRNTDIFGLYLPAISDCISFIEKLMYNSQNGSDFWIFKPWSGSGPYEGFRAYYFEISDISIIPQNLFSNFATFVNTYFTKLYTSSQILDPTRDEDLFAVGIEENNSYHLDSTFVKLKNNANELVNIKDYTLSKSFKRYAVGTVSQKFPLENIGTTINIKLFLQINKYTYTFMLDLQNQLIDISDSFIVNVPFSYLNGSEMSALRLNKKLTTINGITKIATGIAETGLDIASAIGTGGISLFGEKPSKVSTKIKSKLKSGKTKWKTTTKSVGGKTSALDLASDDVSGLAKTVSGITDLMGVNLPFMNTSKGTFLDSDGLLNARFSLVEYVINSNNDGYVNEMFNETGYEVYEFINKDMIYNLLFSRNYLSNNYNYNVIKFATCNVYGSFPRSVAENLNSILEDGVKIWYDYQMQEDTLKVENYGNV